MSWDECGEGECDSDTGYHQCPKCGNPGHWGLTVGPGSHFRRCPNCGWPGQ